MQGKKQNQTKMTSHKTNRQQFMEIPCSKGVQDCRFLVYYLKDVIQVLHSKFLQDKVTDAA